MPRRESSVSKALDGLRGAFSRRSSVCSTVSTTSSRSSISSRSSSLSPKLERPMSFMSSHSSNSSSVSTDTRAALAEQGYPHLHVKEQIYESCTRFPKHMLVEKTQNCKCGKVALEKHKEWCYLQGPCKKCDRERVNTFQGTNVNLNMFQVR